MAQASPSLAAVANNHPQTEPPVDSSTVLRHIAHELRQPLSGIETVAYYLKLVVPQSNDKVQTQLDKMQQMVHQANWILSDAIHFVQPELRHAELLDLNEVIARCVSDSVFDDDLDIRLTLASGVPLLCGDLPQLQHLTQTLLRFLRQLSRCDGDLRVASRYNNNQVILTVSAVAPLYHPENLREVFEPFSPHSPGGCGLALASVKRIADLHQADIRIETAPGGVISIDVSFPAVAQNLD